MTVNKNKTPLTLIILDGFGYRAEREGNAIALAKMPFYDEIREKYPHTLFKPQANASACRKASWATRMSATVSGGRPRSAH